MILEKINPKLVEVVTFKIQTQQLMIHPDVLEESPNSEFFVLETSGRVYLIHKYGKVLLHIVAIRYYFKFSSDNKYFAILFLKETSETFLMLFSLESHKVLWNLQFEVLINKWQNQIIFLQDYLLLSFCSGVRIISYNGLIKKNTINLTPREQEYEMFELDNNLLLFSNFYYQSTYFLLICKKRLKKLKKLNQQKLSGYEFAQLFSQLLVIHSGSLKLSELVNGKIIRKFPNIGIIIGSSIHIHGMTTSLINQELYVFQQNFYFKINLAKGKTTHYIFQIPYPLIKLTDRVFRDPFLIQILKIKGKFGKKRKITLKLHKFII